MEGLFYKVDPAYICMQGMNAADKDSSILCHGFY